MRSIFSHEPAAADFQRRQPDFTGLATQCRGDAGTSDDRRGFVDWVTEAISPRNIAGVADPERRNLYPVDFAALIERHALLRMSRDQLLERMPALRGMAPDRDSLR